MKRNYTPSVEMQPKKKTEAKPAPKPVVRSKYTPSAEMAAAPSEDDSILDSVLDTAYAAAQGATFNYADELYGVGKSLYEAGDLSQYETHRDAARARWDEAKERSPGLTFAGEVAGSVLSPSSKVLAAGKGLRGVVRGVAEGAVQASGASDDEVGSREFLTETATGAGVGGATGLIANTLTRGFRKSPNDMRAEAVGSRAKDYLADGPADRRKSLENLSKTGLFKNRKMEFDAEKLEFKPLGKSKFQLDELEKNTEERLLTRAQDAVKKIQIRKERDFGRLLTGRRVSHAQLEQMAEEVADEYVRRGLIKGPEARLDSVRKVYENIQAQIEQLGGDLNAPTLDVLDKVKRMAQEDVKNFSKALGDVSDNDELARIVSRKLKELVENNLGSDRLAAEFKKLNGAQHDFLNVATDLQDKMRKLATTATGRPQLEKTNFLETFVDSAMGGTQGKLDRAALKEGYQRVVPEAGRAVIPYALEETPGVIYRQQVQDGTTTGRRPQSVGGVENIPEQLIRTPLPRSSAELMEKKPFVLAKVAQMMPEMFDAVQDVFENDPEQLPELAQVIAQKMPQFFARDKYNRFDGRIFSEQDKNRAIKDTLLRKDIGSIRQAEIITKLNQEGIFEE